MLFRAAPAIDVIKAKKTHLFESSKIHSLQTCRFGKKAKRHPGCDVGGVNVKLFPLTGIGVSVLLNRLLFLTWLLSTSSFASIKQQQSIIIPPYSL
jgi:hypothetical protein